jgi:hypothetical protein
MNAPLSRGELLTLLNVLLESERAGAKALMAWQHDPPPGIAPALLGDIARDEARYSGGLSREIRRLGGEPSKVTGPFYERIMALKGWRERFELLDRGQKWVARRIAEVLPRIDDPELGGFLREMHDTHLVNIDRAAKAAAGT